MIGDAQRAKRELGLCEEDDCPERATTVVTPKVPESFRFAFRYCDLHAGEQELGWHRAALGRRREGK